MTRSIFDPTGPNTERSGSRNLGPDAGNISHMPSSVTDGEVSGDEVRDFEQSQGLAPTSPESEEDAQFGAEVAKALDPNQPPASSQNPPNPGP